MTVLLERAVRVVLAAALGAAQIVAAGCSGSPDAPVQSSTKVASPLDSAKQKLVGMGGPLTYAGVLRAEAHADSSFLFDDGLRQEWRGVRITFMDTAGVKLSELTALEATFDVNAAIVHLRSVVMTSVDGRKLETNQVRYELATNKLAGDSAFTYVEATKRQVTDTGFEVDPALRKLSSRNGAEPPKPGTRAR